MRGLTKERIVTVVLIVAIIAGLALLYLYKYKPTDFVYMQF